MNYSIIYYHEYQPLINRKYHQLVISTINSWFNAINWLTDDRKFQELTDKDMD